MRRLALIALAAIAYTAPARAHLRSESYLAATIAGRDAGVEITTTETVLGRTDLAELLDRRVQLFDEAGACDRLRPMRALAASPGYARAETAFRCAGTGEMRLRYDGFFDTAPSHVAFLRVSVSGAGLTEAVLTADRREVPIGASARHAEQFGTFVALGIEHILTGLDHIAFLIGLFLALRRAGSGVRLLIAAVTGFTLGHSLTLGLAVFGVIHPLSRGVEALIGLTVALVAIEGAATWLVLGVAGAIAALAMFATPPLMLLGAALFAACYLALVPDHAGRLWFRLVLTALFGLVHGAGFAAGLIELDLDRAQLAAAVLGFNIGIELGQLAIIAVLFGLARVFAKSIAEEIADGALAGLGMFWLVTRSLS